MAAEFVRVNATDFVRRGARLRLTYQKSRLLGWAAAKMPTIWAGLASLEPGAIAVSPSPADAPVAVIDVKVPMTAPSWSVGAYADSLDVFANVDLVRVEAIDATDLSATTASAARTQQTADALRERQAFSPFNVFGNVTGAVKFAAVAAIVVTLAVVAIRYLPARKERR